MDGYLAKAIQQQELDAILDICVARRSSARNTIARKTSGRANGASLRCHS